MTSDPGDYTAWVGHTVMDPAGENVGTVRAIFVDDATGEPKWVAVSTGTLRRRPLFVPLRGASDDGGRLVIGWDKATVNGSPRVGDDRGGTLSPTDEDTLWVYYSQNVSHPAGSSSGGQGSEPDGVMIRSEEQARFGTRREESGRARLRKYVVTQRISGTVPVAHEELRVDRVTLAGAERVARRQQLSEEVYELVLFADRPVVHKDIVAVERVRLSKTTVTDEKVVTTEVRKEQIVEETTFDEP